MDDPIIKLGAVILMFNGVWFFVNIWLNLRAFSMMERNLDDARQNEKYAWENVESLKDIYEGRANA